MCTVFVSYSHEDAEWVGGIVATLEGAGHRVFFDRDRIAEFQSIPAAVRGALESAELGVVCWSDSAAASRWVEAEEAALAAGGRPVLRVERATPPSELLRRVEMGDRLPLLLAADDDAAAAQRIAHALGIAPTTEFAPARLTRALEQGAPLILVWSASAKRDPAVQSVLDSALMVDIKKGARRIHPYLLDDTPLPLLLAGVKAPRTVEELMRALAPSSTRGEYRIIERRALDRHLRDRLTRMRNLFLLGPRRCGGVRIAESVIESAGFSEQRVTRLRPLNVHSCDEADYYRDITNDDRVDSPADFRRWLLGRMGGERHLVLLVHDGGPNDHLVSMTGVLRAVFEDGHKRLFIIAVGGAQAARLRMGNEMSLFCGMELEIIPSFNVAEVQQLLVEVGEDARFASGVHAATGGHPGFLHEVLTAEGPVDEASVTQRLATSTQVIGILTWRLKQDDLARLPTRLHSESVLHALLAGEEVRRLASLHNDVDCPEVRLFYDAMLVEENGRTTFRCEAVRQAAAAALALRVRG